MKKHQEAFTLVELALVIVILGLIIGGVIVGQDLIRGGQIRAVTSEYQRYAGAVVTFRDKYFGLPGDITNATSIWGDNASKCADAAITDGTPGTCNGDGDGAMDVASAADATGEIYQFWNQLSLAGITGGYYTGTAGSGGAYDHVLGTNSPTSKVTGGGWAVSYAPNNAGGANHFEADYGNYFFFGGQYSGNLPITALLTPADAFSIDTKLDDGKPGTGTILAYYRATCANSTAVDDYAATYTVTDTSKQCALYFLRQF